jgi:hypothetical protein
MQVVSDISWRFRRIFLKDTRKEKCILPNVQTYSIGCLFVVSVVCFQVEVSATSWSLVQRSPTDCSVSLCVIYKPQEWAGHYPRWVAAPQEKKYIRITSPLWLWSVIIFFSERTVYVYVDLVKLVCHGETENVIQSKHFVTSESKNKIRTQFLDMFIRIVPNKFNILKRDQLIIATTISFMYNTANHIKK